MYGGNLAAYERLLAAEQAAAERAVTAASADVRREHRDFVDAQVKAGQARPPGPQGRRLGRPAQDRRVCAQARRAGDRGPVPRAARRTSPCGPRPAGRGGAGGPRRRGDPGRPARHGRPGWAHHPDHDRAGRPALAPDVRRARGGLCGHSAWCARGVHRPGTRANRPGRPERRGQDHFAPRDRGPGGAPGRRCPAGRGSRLGLPRRDPGGRPRHAVPAFGRDYPLAPSGPRSRPDRDRPAVSGICHRAADPYWPACGLVLPGARGLYWPARAESARLRERTRPPGPNASGVWGNWQPDRFWPC